MHRLVFGIAALAVSVIVAPARAVQLTNLDKCEVFELSQFIAKSGFTVTWTGECKDGKATGEGKLILIGKRLSNGPYFVLETYTGSLKNGSRNGQGIREKFFAPGLTGRPILGTPQEITSGNWVEGKLNGQGSVKWSKGSNLYRFYKGHFKNHRFDGHGVYTGKDGKHCEGTFRNGEPFKITKGECG